MNMKMLVAAVVFAGMCGGVAAAQDAAPPGDPVRGRTSYMELKCFACHGGAAQGGGWQGPKLSPGLLPWDAFEGQVRHPAKQMPPYRKAALSEAELADVYAYLQSIPAPAKTADEIPLLSGR